MHTLYRTQVYIGVLNIFVNKTISWCVPLERERIARAARVVSAPPPPPTGSSISTPHHQLGVVSAPPPPPPNWELYQHPPPPQLGAVSAPPNWELLDPSLEISTPPIFVKQFSWNHHLTYRNFVILIHPV